MIKLAPNRRATLVNRWNDGLINVLSLCYLLGHQADSAILDNDLVGHKIIGRLATRLYTSTKTRHPLKPVL